MLVTMRDILPRARAEGYAVGLFNTLTPEMVKGVIAAAEESRSPVIIGTAEILLPYAGLRELSRILRPLAEEATVPVVLHYDHGLTEEKVKEAISLGFSSVMYDCSTLPFEENKEKVAAMTAYAHARGVSVEAELGHVGNGDGSDHSSLTDVAEALDFVNDTGVDALAVAIGTAHGVYKEKPCLSLERLRELAAVLSLPLVLHGGSGLTREQFSSVIAEGIAKVNIFTDLNQAAARAARDGYRDGCGFTDLMGGIEAAVKTATLEKMAMFGCMGRD